MDLYPERLLPAPILAKTVRSGNELAWRRAGDLREALAAARELGLAAVGGQVQFILGEGTCELYWRSYDAADRGAAESWPAYVERSHREVAAALRRLPDPDALVAEGAESFAPLQARAAAGVDLRDHLAYVCYFAAPQAG